jgi:hypothetical protein
MAARINEVRDWGECRRCSQPCDRREMVEELCLDCQDAPDHHAARGSSHYGERLEHGFLMMGEDEE